MLKILLIVLLIYVIFNKPVEGFEGKQFYKSKETLRKLFSERAMWIKVFIEDNLQDKFDKMYIRERIYKNNTDIKKYLLSVSDRKKIVRTLYKLLVERSKLIISLINQVQTQNENEIKISIYLLNEHSRKFAKFLSKNSKDMYEVEDLNGHFLKQNKHVYRMTKEHFILDHLKEIKEYGAFYDHILKLSDMLNKILFM